MRADVVCGSDPSRASAAGAQQVPGGGPTSSEPHVTGQPGFTPRPSGLGGPLAWLAGALQAQDEARLEQVWKLAPRDLGLLERCVHCFARRYPDAPATKEFVRRLIALRRQRVLRRTLAGVAAALGLLLCGGTYDAFGEAQARRFAAVNANDPAAVRERWRSYQTWHPTRNLLRPLWKFRKHGQCGNSPGTRRQLALPICSMHNLRTKFNLGESGQHGRWRGSFSGAIGRIAALLSSPSRLSHAITFARNSHRGHGPVLLAHVVAHDYVALTDIEPAIQHNWMRPAGASP